MNTNKVLILLSLAVLGGGVINAATEPVKIQKPEAITIVEPEVPYDFIRWGVTGTVTVSFKINAEGVPEDIAIESACNKVYARNVVAAVNQWRFVPPEIEGVRYLMPVVFH